jgi:hypothetical protein
VLAPLAAYIDRLILEWIFRNYEMGFEFLIMNGLYTFIGLWIISRRPELHAHKG